MVQVKIILEGRTHRALKAKAALKGLTLKDYLVSVLDKIGNGTILAFVEISKEGENGERKAEEKQ